MKHQHYRYAALSVALAMALTACGGGGSSGGNVKQPTPPPPPPPPAVCEDANATNKGGALPCTYRYTGAADNVLVPVRADLAHASGFTGMGVKVGVLDDGIVEGYAPLDRRVASYKDYTGHEGVADPSQKHGHGAVVSTVLGGAAGGGFKGGVAPDAELHWARVCYDDACWSYMAQEAVADMAANGIRLFNLSFGGDYQDEDTTRNQARSWRHALGGVAAVDGLAVNSAGNGSGDQPGAISHVPRFHADFKAHLLTAVAVDVDSKGDPVGLSDFSNACGAAAEWCVAAPGRVTFPAIPSTIWTGGAQGTSNAAPIVTGTAALVWQAFPWMSASNVQQTVLTTATDLGAPGVDAVFGWGMVNAEKAVRGPGMFTGTFRANVGSGSYDFANDISGDGGIVKRGAGRLVLTGNNSYTGMSEVIGGELALVNGTAGSVRVGTGATFEGAGRIGGDFTAATGATTAIAVGKPLEVAGTASLDGTLKILNGAAGYTVGASEKLMDFGALEGRFDDVTYGSGFFYSAELDYSASSLIARLTRTSTAGAAMAMNASTQAVQGGRQADTLFGVTDTLSSPAGFEQLIASAAKLASAPTQAQADASLASLTGEVHGTARAVAIQQAVNADQLLGDRAATLDPANAGVWVAASGVDGAFERGGYADADYRQSGMTFGVDRDFDGVLAGIALSSGRGRADLDALGGDFDADTDAISAYARVGLASGYLSGTVSHARSDVDMQRNLLLGEDVVSVAAGRKDTTWSARIEAGRTFGLFTPFIAGGWIGHEQGAFTETGGDGLGLSAASDDASVHYGELGVRLAHRLDRVTLRGVLAGRWVGGDTSPDYAAHFTGAPDAGFTITGQRVPGNSARAGAGVEFASSPRVLWSFDLGGETGAGDSSNVYISGAYRYSF